jgi:urease accessory protein
MGQPSLFFSATSMSFLPSASKRNEAGYGRVQVSSHCKKAIFSELSATYPLKLLAPTISTPHVAVLYLLSYGGGLVGGDQVHIDAEILKGAILVILTQVSSGFAAVETGIGT